MKPELTNFLFLKVNMQYILPIPVVVVVQESLSSCIKIVAVILSCPSDYVIQASKEPCYAYMRSLPWSTCSMLVKIWQRDNFHRKFLYLGQAIQIFVPCRIESVTCRAAGDRSTIAPPVSSIVSLVKWSQAWLLSKRSRVCFPGLTMCYWV